ncbi:MAG: AAA family ATPase [Bacteroidales bacterium]|nr:AAA family ATPase [Bacteroidales bacterium]
MPIPTQKLKAIEINKLKGLNNLYLDFESNNLTAIMGVNGSGKTSILHAIACCYKPYSGQNSRNYIFSEFFTPNTDSQWAGSEFKLHYEHQLANPRYPNQRTYKKDSDRWSPRYATRLQRWVSYIGIRESVPAIEDLKTKSYINLTKVNKQDAQSNQIRVAASHILNKNYTIYSDNTAGKKQFMGVEHKHTHYSAISMGSGEQRVFKILEQLYKAPEYGLLLIDEIELLMHTDALKRLIKKLDEIARAKHIQIIFTTHSDIILQLKEFINIRHIFVAEDGNAFCIKDSNPKLLYELTGNSVKPISIYVEDELSKEIIFQVAKELGIRQHVKTDIFGPAINCFTTAAGAVLNGLNIDNSLFVIDGDLYTTKTEKRDRMNAVLTGSDFASRRKKIKALNSISQFTLPTNTKPEQFLHSQIILTVPNNLDEERLEIRNAAIAIEMVDDAHKFIDDIILRLGYEKDDYRDIVKFICGLPFWDNYIKPIKDWMQIKITELNL